MPTPEHGTIDCEEAVRRLAEYLDHALEDASQAEVERHLETCRGCYSRAEFERALRGRLRELRQEPVDPAFESRICKLTKNLPTS